MKQKSAKILWASLFCGAASIIFELVWVRYLALILGSSAYSIGVVTACYMTGLALGDFLLGRLLETSPRPIATFVFVGLASFCFLSPLVYSAISGLNGLWMAGRAGSAPLPLRAAIAFGALLLPTFLIGGVLPALIKRAGGCAGKLYACHTLGSVLGAVLAGFFLIRFLGLWKSAAAAGVLVLASFFLLPRDAAPATQKNLQKPAAAYPARVKAAALAVYTLSGFTGMAFQAYQTKILTLFFMDSAYDFAIILAVYLAGLFAGNVLSSHWAKKSAAPARLLAYSQMALGICSIFSLYLVSRLPYWTQGLSTAHTLYMRFGDAYFLCGVGLKIGYTLLVVAPSALLWGCAFPLVSKLCIDGAPRPAKAAGFALGLNTIGSALGSLLAAFVFLSLLGLHRSIVLGGLLNFAAGMGLLLVCAPRPSQLNFGVAAAAMSCALFFLPAWNRFEMSTSFLAPGQDVQGSVDMLYYQEDAYGITSVVDFLPYSQKYLTTNRLYCQNTSGMVGAEDHRRLSYIPLLLHPDPKEVLVTGLGAGVTLRGAVEYGGLNIDCVEISKSVVQAASYFNVENGGALQAPGVSLVVDDARSYVAASKDRYDVIIADIFFPMSSGSSSLFSTEYYRACRQALRPGGLMAQWLPLHQFSPEELAITVKTFAEVFPHVTLWYGMLGEDVPVAGLIGSETPLERSFGALEALYREKPALAETLAQTALDDPYMFLSHYIGKVDFAALDASLPLNTDDRPILEFLNPRQTASYSQRGRENLAALGRRKQSAADFVSFSQPHQAEILASYDAEISEFAARFQ